MRAHRYGAVVLYFDIQLQNSAKVRVTGFPQPWVLAILEGYEEIGSLEMPGPEKVFDDDRFHVWVPRSREPEPSRTPLPEVGTMYSAHGALNRVASLMTPTGVSQTVNLDSAAISRKGILLAAVALLLAAAFAGRQVSSWPARLRYPGEQNFVEGMRLAEMQHLRRGVPIYAPASAERFDASIYGPLYYLVGSRLLDPDRPAYLPLRLLSMLATLGCAGCGALLAYWLARSLLAALLAPLIFLAYGFVTAHGLSARSDLVALLLSLAGFLIAYRFQDRPLFFVSVPLMLLGFFYKQQFVAGSVAILLFLLWEKRFRRAAEFAGCLILGGLGMLALFQFAVFPGQAFFRHFFVYNLIPFSWKLFLLGVGVLLLMFLVPLLVALEYLRQSPNRLLGCYLICAAVLSLLTLAKEGSDSNYYLEFALILSVLFAAMVSRSLADSLRSTELLVLLTISLFFAQWLTRPAPPAEDFERDRIVQDYLRSHFAPQTPVLAYQVGDCVRAGMGVPISDLYQYAQLYLSGRLPDQNFQSQFQERRFGAVILNFDIQNEDDSKINIFRFPKPWAQAIRRDYEPAATLEMPGPEKMFDDDRFYVWVPRARTTTPGSQPNR